MTQLQDNLLINIAIGFGVAIVCLLIGRLLWRKLRESEQLKYEFVTIIAHKFRTPLTHVKWGVGELVTNEQDPHKKEALQEIINSNESLIRLTNTLIELTDSAGNAISSYKFERVNLCDLARAALEVSKHDFHEKNLFMSVNCAAPDIFANIDRARMDFVIGTLLENACNYTPPGRDISVTVSADRRKAAISVTDDGIGIEPREMARVFTKFYRAKGAASMDTEGFGVGLYLSKAIVKRHGGTIRAFSEGSGKGSTFSIILPRVK